MGFILEHETQYPRFRPHPYPLPRNIHPLSDSWHMASWEKSILSHVGRCKRLPPGVSVTESLQQQCHSVNSCIDMMFTPYCRTHTTSDQNDNELSILTFLFYAAEAWASHCATDLHCCKKNGATLLHWLLTPNTLFYCCKPAQWPHRLCIHPQLKIVPNIGCCC